MDVLAIQHFSKYELLSSLMFCHRQTESEAQDSTAQVAQVG